MSQTSTNNTGRRLLLALLLLLVVGGGVAFTQRHSLRAWLMVRQLAKADELDRDRLAERVAALGEPAVTPLLNCLQRPDPAVCNNVRAALSKLGIDWGIGDARLAALLRRCNQEWPQLSVPGRCAVLQASSSWFRSRPKAEIADGLLPAAGELLSAVTTDDAEVRAAGLDLCECLAILPAADAVRGPARDVVRSCFQIESAPVRLRAVRTAQRPGMDLSAEVAGLLGDASVDVRRAALLAVGPPDRDVLDETLLPCLHDEDEEIRQLAEDALKGRGLTPEQLQLGRLLTDPNFLVRMRVLEELQRFKRLEESGHRAVPIDPNVWLRRLSHDAMPSVRAAAARMIAENMQGNNADLLDQMARNDPSPTVCFLARYYLKNARVAEPGE